MGGCFYPAKRHRAALVAGGVDPIGQPRVSVGDDDPYTPVVAVGRCVLVDVDLVVAVVQRLQPVIVELEVPAVARGDLSVDDERLVGAEPPITVVVDDVRLATGESFLHCYPP